MALKYSTKTKVIYCKTEEETRQKALALLNARLVFLKIYKTNKKFAIRITGQNNSGDFEGILSRVKIILNEELLELEITNESN